MNEEKVFKWRLSEKPTVENLKSLVDSQIITKEEAKKIILDESKVSQADIEEIKSEISILRKLVLEKPNVETIRIIEREMPTWKPYWGWTTQYYTTCSSLSLADLSSGTGGTTLTSGTANIPSNATITDL